MARARFYDVIPPIQYYFWPERGIVLIAEMREPSRPVETEAVLPHHDVAPHGSDVVIAHVQFEPIPLDLDRCAEIADKINEQLPSIVPP